MLLPILIQQRDVNKYLKNSAFLANKNGITVWISKFVFSISNYFCYLPVGVTSCGTINASPLWSQRHLIESDNGKYIGVFANHSSQKQENFQQMSVGERQELLNDLKLNYTQILIDYFSTDKTLKEKIDKFINTIFYANIPVPQIIEIHMEIIDEFSKQLKLEGRSNETLLDYRLTLIEILAHLCEVYRCSIDK